MRPTYEGHIALLERSSGRVAHVWNAECSNRHALIDPPSSCTADTTFGGSAIWGRPGAIVLPGSRRLLVATGNGPFNGSTNWGDSVIELSPDASRILHTWTPSNQAQLNSNDTDLGSTEPALLPGGLELQGGKSGVLALLDLSRQGVGGTGGELQTLSAPGSDRGVHYPGGQRPRRVRRRRLGHRRLHPQRQSPARRLAGRDRRHKSGDRRGSPVRLRPARRDAARAASRRAGRPSRRCRRRPGTGPARSSSAAAWSCRSAAVPATTRSVARCSSTTSRADSELTGSSYGVE